MNFIGLLFFLIKIIFSEALIKDVPNRELEVPLSSYATEIHPMSLKLEAPYETPQRQYLIPRRQYLAPKPIQQRKPQQLYTAPKYTQAIFKHTPKAYYPSAVQRTDETYLSNEEPSSYRFGYAVHNDRTQTHFGHSEDRQNNVVHGEYFVLLPDGRLQTVKYTADEHGFHPIITYS